VNKGQGRGVKDQGHSATVT